MVRENKRRVVVTGLGVVSSIGIGWQDFWKSLLAGKSGISEVEYIDSSKYDRKYAGQVKNFHPESFISKNHFKFFGRSSQMGIAACHLAISDAKIDYLDNKFKQDMAILMGSTMAEMGVLEGFLNEYFNISRVERGEDFFSAYPVNSLSSNIASFFKLQKQNAVFTNACCSGNYSIGRAFDLIKSGRVKYALAGGADRFSRIVFTGFNRLIAVAQKECRPFDLNRDGIIPGEGAGVLLLEELNSVEDRGGKIYAELKGYGVSADAQHMTNPSFIGIEKCIRKALKAANIQPKDVNYVSAHGTGTRENDKAECIALNRVFNGWIKNVPVSSIKSMLGHTMGAASALESIACCLAIKDQKIPPTINYETPDPECSIDCVPNNYRNHEVKFVLNNASAFGGNNASSILSLFKK